MREAKRILALAIKWGDTTVHDFRGVDGTEGKFVQKLKITTIPCLIFADVA